jgi:hypothetical protein
MTHVEKPINITNNALNINGLRRVSETAATERHNIKWITIKKARPINP